MSHQVLQDLHSKHSLDAGTKKPIHYLDIYSEYLSKFRNSPIRILELGIYSGASLLMWRDYFSSATIVGLDVRSAPKVLLPMINSNQIFCVAGDQSAPESLDQCKQLAGGAFDVIIDDASHVGGLSEASFNYAFANLLVPGGLYFVEDYGTGYIDGFYDGASFERPAPNKEDKRFKSHDHGMVGWVKRLIDEMHGFAILPTEADKQAIKACHFWPSIALIEKSS